MSAAGLTLTQPALVVMMLGLTLVKPRDKKPAAADPTP